MAVRALDFIGSPLGTPRWFSGAVFASVLGLVLYVLAGVAGPASNRWGLYGVLVLQAGAWQAVTYRYGLGSAPEILTRVLLTLNTIVFIGLDFGVYGPIVDLYYFYEARVVPVMFGTSVALSALFIASGNPPQRRRFAIAVAAALAVLVGVAALSVFGPFRFLRDFAAPILAVAANVILIRFDPRLSPEPVQRV